MRPYFIYNRPNSTVFNYTVMIDEPWPYGEIVGVTMTRRGAVRLAKRKANKRILVEKG